jgi:hypothetical protein
MKIIRTIIIILGIGLILFNCLIYWEIYTNTHMNLNNAIYYQSFSPFLRLMEFMPFVLGVVCLFASTRIKINEN